MHDGVRILPGIVDGNVHAVFHGRDAVAANDLLVAVQHNYILDLDLQVGDAAPGFEITGANRGGILDAPLRLDDYRGKTVVLAFFYKVRTPG